MEVGQEKLNVPVGEDIAVLRRIVYLSEQFFVQLYKIVKMAQKRNHTQ